MEKFEQKFEEQSDFDLFKSEIQKIKEEQEKRELPTGDLIKNDYSPGVDPEELKEEDMEVWEKFKAGKLDMEDFEEYNDDIPLEDTNRRVFAAFVNNKLMGETLKKQVELAKKEVQKKKNKEAEQNKY